MFDEPTNHSSSVLAYQPAARALKNGSSWWTQAPLQSGAAFSIRYCRRWRQGFRRDGRDIWRRRAGCSWLWRCQPIIQGESTTYSAVSRKQSDFYLRYHPDNNLPPGPRDCMTVLKRTKYDRGNENQCSRDKKTDHLNMLTTREGKCHQHDKWEDEQEGAGDNISCGDVRLQWSDRQIIHIPTSPVRVRVLRSELQSRKSSSDDGVFLSKAWQGAVKSQHMIPMYITANATATPRAHRLKVPQAGNILVIDNVRLMRVNLEPGMSVRRGRRGLQ